MKIERTTSWGCVAALALSLAPASAAASIASPVVSMDVAGECAGPEQVEILREEVSLRLPEGARLARAEQGADWTLSWAPIGGVCQLTLAGHDELVAVELAAMAPRANVRDAAVRVAWWISTAAEESVELEVASSEPVVPRPLEDEPKALGPDEALSSALGIELEPEPRAQTPRGGAGERPAGANAPVDMLVDDINAERPSPKVKDGIDVISASLESWRDSSPELFGAHDSTMTEPLTLDIFGEQVGAGVYVELAPHFASFDGQGAAGWGVQAGLVLEDTVGVGLGYRGLESEASPQAQSGRPDIDTHSVTVAFEYTPWMGEDWRLSAQLEGGASFVSYRGHGTELMPTVGLRAQGYYDVLEWMQVGAGVGYQAYLGQELLARSLSAQQLSGGYGQLLFRMSLF